MALEDRTCSERDVEAALVALHAGARRVPAASWPHGLDDLDQSGLYSWTVDEPGARALSAGLREHVPAGLIYAGQAGATAWPSGKVRAATLRSRIGANHVRGRIRGSTFRLTLAAALLEPLEVSPVAALRLERAAEERLSQWIGEHLHVATLPFPDRDRLRDLEHRVLAALDPPLNLDGMAPTPTREALSLARARLGSGRPGADQRTLAWPEAVVADRWAKPACPFCGRLEQDLLADEPLAVAFDDAYPVSKGHALVVPRRHEPDLFALSEEEQAAIWRLVNAVQSSLRKELRPHGFNVGVNSGVVAGQTVPHAHVHVIPRYRGDVHDPRGGIRWVKPDLARYWSQ